MVDPEPGTGDGNWSRGRKPGGNGNQMEALDEDGPGAPAVGGVGPGGVRGMRGPEVGAGSVPCGTLLGNLARNNVYLTKRREKEVDSTTHLAGDTWILGKPLSTSVAPESIISC